MKFGKEILGIGLNPNDNPEKKKSRKAMRIAEKKAEKEGGVSQEGIENAMEQVESDELVAGMDD